MRWIVLLLLVACGRVGYDGIAPGNRDASSATDVAPAGGDAASGEVGDAPVGGAVAFAAQSHAFVPGQASSLTYSFTTPAGANRVLLVTVHLGSGCGGAVPLVSAVSYGAVALTPITSILGTLRCLAGIRSEQWLLVAPREGTANVQITLSAIASTIHSSAMAFTGVNQSAPVRAFDTASGTSQAGSATVASAPGDLVVSVVGNGDDILAPGGGQTQIFLENVNASYAMNNSAASTQPGAAPSVEATWSFRVIDEWQIIATSLRP